MHATLEHVVPKLVRGPVCHPRANPTASHPSGETARMMVALVIARLERALGVRHTPKLASPNHESIFQQSALTLPSYPTPPLVSVPCLTESIQPFIRSYCCSGVISVSLSQSPPRCKNMSLVIKSPSEMLAGTWQKCCVQQAEERGPVAETRKQKIFTERPTSRILRGLHGAKSLPRCRQFRSEKAASGIRLRTPARIVEVSYDRGSRPSAHDPRIPDASFPRETSGSSLFLSLIQS